MEDNLLADYSDILNVEELRQVLKLGRTAVYKLLSKGDIKSVKIGNSYRIPKKYVIDYLYNNVYIA